MKTVLFAAAWTSQPLTIYGSNFGYDLFAVRVSVDTALAQVTDAEDTMLTVSVPDGARTGFIHVWAYEQTATSATPVVVEYTFNPHYIFDSVPDGRSFSIPGTGMNHSRGILRLYVGGISYPIDSVFPDRIVSHAIPNSLSGQVTISDSNGTYNCGTLIVTRPCSWRTLSEIWDNLTVTETHHRTGYINGPAHTIDSTWKTTATYSGQRDTNIAGTFFSRTVQGLAYLLNQSNPKNSPLLQITWDTAHQIAAVSFRKDSYMPASSFHTGDTIWYDNGQSLPALLPVDGDIEFMLPAFAYQISEDSMDTQGLVNWQETTTTTVTSGMFDIILKR
ncbi:MAG TPA: IPT/TIG domain-containing protein [Candidatus Kapabacteria bacterium]|nr:IPT/TIG domain-containing protein [Candidatus Kapabacteria bacterium]